MGTQQRPLRLTRIPLRLYDQHTVNETYFQELIKAGLGRGILMRVITTSDSSGT